MRSLRDLIIFGPRRCLHCDPLCDDRQCAQKHCPLLRCDNVCGWAGARETRAFQEVVLTTDDFFPERRVDFPGSDREYERERAAFHKRANYRLAFNFLARFVSTIEATRPALPPNLCQMALASPWKACKT